MRWEELNLNHMISEAASEIHGRYPLILRGYSYIWLFEPYSTGKLFASTKNP